MTTHLHTRHRGLVPTAQLGTGSSISGKFLRGDQTWQTVTASGAITVEASGDEFTGISHITFGTEFAGDAGGAGEVVISLDNPLHNHETEVFSGTGSEDTFTLAFTPTGPGAVLVFVGGAFVAPSAYSLVGDDIVFDTPPASGTDNVHVLYAHDI